MKFRETFDIHSIDFFQVDIKLEFNRKERISTQSPLSDLIKLVHKIKSDKIYAFFGIGTSAFLWDRIMFIYSSNVGFILEIYKNDTLNSKIIKQFTKKFSNDEFKIFISKYKKRWNFDENLVY